MKARVIVTQLCPKNCDGCCNKEYNMDEVQHISIRLLQVANEIIITGGEPFLETAGVEKLIKTLRSKGYNKPIYIYTAMFPTTDQVNFWNIVRMVDGITFTIHYESQISDLMTFISYIPIINSLCKEDEHKMSLRLHYDSRISSSLINSPLTAAIMYNWQIKAFKWIKNCPLPEDEVLCRYLI